MKNSLLSSLQNLLKEKKAFVFYRKPNTNTILSMVPNHTELQYVSDFTGKGFVFAPFDAKKKSIVFSLNNSILSKYTYNTTSDINNIIDFPNSKEDRDKHIQLIKDGVDFIQRNKISKIVLSRKEIITYSNIDIVATFKNLLVTYRTAFVYIWYHPKVGLWLGATPETLVEMNNNSFKTMALAGTQEYKGLEDVAWGEKEIQEHQFVTDYIKEQLSKMQVDCKISNTDTVRAGNLLHIHASITGRLKDKRQIGDLIKALHPTPAVCGYPKEKAKKYILENENYDREFYTGFLGELNFTSDKRQNNNNRRNIENHAYQYKETQTSLYVNLRCMQIKESNINIYLGGGVTKDSIPKSEYQETVAKSKVMKSIIT